MLKKALLVGINAYADAPLRGCVNDAAQMRDLLTRRFGFRGDDVRVLRDKEASKQGIEEGLAWLAQGSDEDAVRIFYYAGHGKQVPDSNGDEPDGRDEAIVPFDYKRAGFMTDDALRKLYDSFPPASNLTLIMDCCHSGTVNREAEEVRYRFLPATYEEYLAFDAARDRYLAALVEAVKRDVPEHPGLGPEELRRKKQQAQKEFDRRRARFGDLSSREANILLAASRPDQTAADARLGKDYHGAFTWYLVEAISGANGWPTHYEVMAAAGEKLYKAGFGQVPQLECLGKYRNRPIFDPF